MDKRQKTRALYALAHKLVFVVVDKKWGWMSSRGLLLSRVRCVASTRSFLLARCLQAICPIGRDLMPRPHNYLKVCTLPGLAPLSARTLHIQGTRHPKPVLYKGEFSG